MPYVIACPNCGSKLKSAQRLPVGTRCACPQCREAFAISDPGAEMPEQVPPIAPVPPPLPPRAPAATAVPEAILVDEPGHEDEPPTRRSRRARRDDDDEKDRPRRGRDRAKKKSRGPLIALLAGAAALLFLCGGGLVLIYFTDPFGIRGGGASSDMLAWAPADSQSVMYVDVEAARKTDELRNDLLLTGDPSRLGIRTEDISEMVGANRNAGGFLGLLGEPEVLVLRLNRDADRKGIIAATGGREATASGKKYYQTNGGGLYFASDRLVVIAKSESTLIGLLPKDEGKVVVSDDLQAAAKRANGTIAIANVGQAAESTDLLGMMAVPMDNFGPGGPNPRGHMVIGTRARARATVYSIKTSGSKATLRFESTYDSPDSARQVADTVKRNFGQNRSSITDIDSYDVSRSGSTVTLTIEGPVKKRKGFLPFGM